MSTATVPSSFHRGINRPRRPFVPCESTAPLGVTIGFQVVTHCPTCGSEFNDSNLSMLPPGGNSGSPLTCGPCVGLPKRV